MWKHWMVGHPGLRISGVHVLLLASLTWAGGSACEGDVSTSRSSAVSRDLAAVAPPSPIGAGKRASDSAAVGEFAVFWERFRMASLAGDSVALLAMTAMPFRIMGPMDDDPVVERDSAAFLAILPRLLDSDPSLSAQPTTMRQLLNQAATPPQGAVDGDEARVGNFVFTHRAGRWRFAVAYLSDTLPTQSANHETTARD